MKLFTFFFSFYLLTLTCLPCRDSAECNSTAAVTIAADHSHDHDDCDETCSPFCSCSCCASPVFFQKLAAKEIHDTPILKNYSIYRVPSFFSPSSVVWQPPQLS